ncbi:MAG: hypothetical protein J6T55_01050 [Alphaproteobacteria bacterium]|nr:hypothetical protein [Alphaproteobacteria bacterium]
MTEIEKFVKLIMTHLLIFIKEQENMGNMQKELDNFKNSSIYCLKKGKKDDRR